MTVISPTHSGSSFLDLAGRQSESKLAKKRYSLAKAGSVFNFFQKLAL